MKNPEFWEQQLREIDFSLPDETPLHKYSIPEPCLESIRYYTNSLKMLARIQQDTTNPTYPAHFRFLTIEHAKRLGATEEDIQNILDELWTKPPSTRK